MGPIVGSEPVRYGQGARRCTQLEEALAKADSILHIAVARGQVDVAVLVNRRRASALPDGRAIVKGRGKKHLDLLTNIGCVVAEQPAVEDVIISVRTKADVHRVVRKKQPGPL